MDKRCYTTIDLCAGIGGIRRGFEMTGRFKNVLSAEIDSEARKTYSHLYGEVPENDLTTEDFKAKVRKVKADVILAGFPCQTFSSMGLQKGFDDPNKGVIFSHITDMIRRCRKGRPKAIFLENVENLLAHDHRNTINTVLNEIERLGYMLVGCAKKEKDASGTVVWNDTREAFLRYSKDFGVPQRRPRVYIMAFDKKYYGKALEQIGEMSLPTRGKGPGLTDVRQILEEARDVDDRYYLSSGYLETLRKHRKRHADSKASSHNGFGYVIVNEPRQGEEDKPCLAHTIMATGGSGKECNLIKQPKEGINLTDLINGKRSVLNNEGVRMMTPKEWGRLQGFVGYAFVDQDTKEDKFSFPADVSIAQQYKQFGNSVTIPVIEAMAECMVSCLDRMEMLRECNPILDFVERHDKISTKQAAKVLKTKFKQADLILTKLVKDGFMELVDNVQEKTFKRKDAQPN